MAHTKHNKPVIGIVGGIGSGKSFAAGKFVELGCALVSGDAIAHELLKEPDVIAAVRERWGDSVLGSAGQVDRAALGQVVFDDPAEMAELTSLLHPRIGERMARQVADAQTNPAVVAVVIDAAVLFEAGWEDLCDCVVFVDAPLALRLERVAAARGWDEAALARRERLQIELDKKRQICDYIIDNHASDSHLSETVQQLLHRIVSTKDHGSIP